MEGPDPAATTRWVSVSEAARELGISPETVRRWIKTGRLRAERAIRPQGTVWRVMLPVAIPRGVPPVIPVTGHTEAFSQEAQHASLGGAWYPSAPVTPPEPDATALATAVREQAEAIVRLIAEMSDIRGVADLRADRLLRLTETLAGLRDERGRLAAELETAAAEAMMAKMRENRLADELAELRVTLTRYTEILVRQAGSPMAGTPVVERRPWSRHWPWVAVLILSVVAGALVVFPLLLARP